jgi:hypothetical protein
MIISTLPNVREAFQRPTTEGRMRLMTAWCLAAILAVASTAAAAPEWSEDADAPGWASAMSFRTVQGPIAVRPLDNSKLNLELVRRIADALRQRGITVADDAPLLLEFETLTDSNAPRGKRGALERRREVDIGRERDLGRGDAIDARIDVLSNSRSSLLNGVRRPDIAVNYTMRATLSQREGPRLWEGYSEYGEVVRDENRLYAKMASLLAELVAVTGEGRFRVD